MSGAKRSTRKGRWKWRTSRLQTYLPSLLLWSRLSRFRTEKTQFPFWVNKGFANALWKFAISRRVIALMFLSFFACLLAHFFLASFLTPSILLIFHAPFLATNLLYNEAIAFLGLSVATKVYLLWLLIFSPLRNKKQQKLGFSLLLRQLFPNTLYGSN